MIVLDTHVWVWWVHAYVTSIVRETETFRMEEKHAGRRGVALGFVHRGLCAALAWVPGAGVAQTFLDPIPPSPSTTEPAAITDGVKVKWDLGIETPPGDVVDGIREIEPVIERLISARTATARERKGYVDANQE